MFEAYLDETGIHDGAPFCVIAGYFGGPGQFRKFSKSWHGALSAFEVPLAQFHALDFMKGRKFFYGWDAAKRDGLADALAAAVIRYKLYPVSVGLVVDDFKGLTLMQRRFFTGATVLDGRLVTSGCPNKPCFAPFQHCIKQVVSYAAVGGNADFFFGTDRPFAKYAETLYRAIKGSRQPDETRCRLGKIDFPLAKETPALQAADLLAYLTATHMQAHPDGPVQPNGLLLSMLTNIRMMEDHKFFNKETMRAQIESLVGFVPELAFEREDEEQLPMGQ